MADSPNAQTAQNAASGCLARVFTLIGLFWIGVVVVDVLTELQSGGNLQNLDFAGGILPAIAFLFAGNIMRKRVREAAEADTFASPTTPSGTHRATTTNQPSSDRGPTPSPTITAVPVPEQERESHGRPQARRSRPVPELPPIKQPDPGQLRAVENLEVTDFEASSGEITGMSSEEMVRRAREKFMPKRQKPPRGY